MQFRTGTMDDVATLWALRTRCVRETCSSHYPPEVIAPWSASPPPSQYARLLSQGGLRGGRGRAGCPARVRRV